MDQISITLSCIAKNWIYDSYVSRLNIYKFHRVNHGKNHSQFKDIHTAKNNCFSVHPIRSHSELDLSTCLENCRLSTYTMDGEEWNHLSSMSILLAFQ